VAPGRVRLPVVHWLTRTDARPSLRPHLHLRRPRQVPDRRSPSSSESTCPVMPRAGEGVEIIEDVETQAVEELR
jgi:hypothetical protein